MDVEFSTQELSSNDVGKIGEFGTIIYKLLVNSLII
jgi:hypothetical protein